MSSRKGRRQLFVRAPADTKVYRVYEQGRVRTDDVSGMPLPTWPDGRWCIELAAHMDVLKSLRRSLFDRGGTLGTYISELSHLTRYCFANKVDFHSLTDAHFEMFVRNLAAEKNSDGEQVRNATVTATTTVEVLKLHRDDFMQLVKQGVLDSLVVHSVRYTLERRATETAAVVRGRSSHVADTTT